MQSLKRSILFGLLILLLTGCTDINKTSSNTKITIEPYQMSEKESQLVYNTDVGNIEFFKFNGFLAEEDDLQIAVEVYENGKFKETLLKTWGAVEENYKNTYLSFGISGFGDEESSLKLISGIPSGLATTTYANDMTASSFNNLITEKITLMKNEPVYLAAWIGTTKDELRSISSEKGEFPEGIDEAEIAFLYKVLWTDQEENE